MYILNSTVNFLVSSHPYWKPAFYNIDDRLAYLNKV